MRGAVTTIPRIVLYCIATHLVLKADGVLFQEIINDATPHLICTCEVQTDLGLIKLTGGDIETTLQGTGRGPGTDEKENSEEILFCSKFKLKINTEWYPVYSLSIDYSNSTISYAVILHPEELEYYLEIFSWRLRAYLKGNKFVIDDTRSLQSDEWNKFCEEVKDSKRDEFRCIVEQLHSNSGESRVFEVDIDKPDQIENKTEFHFKITAIKPVKKSASDLEFPLDTFFTICINHPMVKNRRVVGLLPSSGQEISINKKDMDHDSFYNMSEYCFTEMNSLRESADDLRITPVEQWEYEESFEVLSRTGSEARANIRRKVFRLDSFTYVSTKPDVPVCNVDSNDVIELTLWFKTFLKPFPQGYSYEAKFDLFHHPGWNSVAVATLRSIDWSERIAFVEPATLQFTNEAEDHVEFLRKQIQISNVPVTISESKHPKFVYSLVGVKDFKRDDVFGHSFKFSSVNLTLLTTDSYYWKLEEMKQEFRSKWDPKPLLTDFELVKPAIGKGGFGTVDLVKHKGTGKEYAKKTLYKEKALAEGPLAVEMLNNEQKTMKAVKFPFLVQLHFEYEDEKYIYLLMDFVACGDMRRFYDKYKMYPEVFSEELCKFYAPQLVLAVEYFHYNDLIHGDIKLDNIFMDGDGCIKLGDFGFARNVKVGEMLTNGPGTPSYAAPELIDGGKGHNIPVDIWALAVVFFIMTQGRAPFEGKDNAEIFSNILTGDWEFDNGGQGLSSEYEDLIGKMLNKNPLKRLTIKQVKEHEWFHGVNWLNVLNKGMKRPFTPFGKTETAELLSNK